MSYGSCRIYGRARGTNGFVRFYSEQAYKGDSRSSLEAAISSGRITQPGLYTVVSNDYLRTFEVETDPPPPPVVRLRIGREVLRDGVG